MRLGWWLAAVKGIFAVLILADLAVASWAAVNGFWFEVLGFTVLRTQKAVGNVRSRGISARTGMLLVGLEEKEFVSGTLPAEIWEMTAEDWRDWKRGRG
ncbi:hypothetical protein GOB94_05145 [Granulicella sp. 5B5]|uniref:hypothetical protein n=1 Tax=Granulicella sp. 5B5 TaxID=1617967 RepID=UPI001772062E|nr:hypothetical protein [Granulicella sp. 5B5]QMV18147.1 hypothetical protein GOB94_05145 [Granulicella sp. 5B5]